MNSNMWKWGTHTLSHHVGPLAADFLFFLDIPKLTSCCRIRRDLQLHLLLHRDATDALCALRPLPKLVRCAPCTLRTRHGHRRRCKQPQKLLHEFQQSLACMQFLWCFNGHPVVHLIPIPNYWMLHLCLQPRSKLE